MFPFALTYFLKRFNWTSSIGWYFPSYSNIIVPMETFGVWMTGWMIIWYWLGSNWQRWWLNGGLWVVAGEKLAEMVETWERELDDGWEGEVWMMGSTMDYGATWLNKSTEFTWAIQMSWTETFRWTFKFIKGPVLLAVKQESFVWVGRLEIWKVADASDTPWRKEQQAGSRK